MAKSVQAPKTQSELAEWLRRVSARQAHTVMYVAQNSVSNTAGVASDLHSYVIPQALGGGYFWKGANGQYIKITARGSFAANANLKTLEILFGSAVFSFSQAINGGKYYAVVEVYKADISTIKIEGILWTNVAAFPVTIGGIGVASAGVRLGEGATVKSRATAAGAADITENYFRVEQFPSSESY